MKFGNTCFSLPCSATSTTVEAVSWHMVNYRKSLHLHLPAARSLLPWLCQLLCCSSEFSMSQCNLRNAEKQPGKKWRYFCCSSESNQFGGRWAANTQPPPRRKQSEWPCTDHFLLYLSFLFVNDAHAEKDMLLELVFFFLNVHELHPVVLARLVSVFPSSEFPVVNQKPLTWQLEAKQKDVSSLCRAVCPLPVTSSELLQNARL